MKIICIDNNLKRSNGSSFKMLKLNLTIGKVYESTGGSPAMWSITCDDGVIREYSAGRFVTLEEWREKQLKELGI